MSSRSPPHGTPAWLTRTRAASVGLFAPIASAWALLLLAVAETTVYDAPKRWTPFVVGSLVGFVAQIALVRFLVSRKHKAEAFIVALAGQACAWALATAAATIADAGAGDRWSSALSQAGTVAVVSMIGSLPLGLWQGGLATIVVGANMRRSHDAVDWMMTRVSGWTVAPAAALALLCLAPGRAPGLLVAAAGLPSIALPLLVLIWTAARRIALRRWLERVEDGRVDGWRVVSDARALEAGLLPLIGDDGGSARYRVLVETAAAREPFREAEAARPVALLPGRE